jgi:hypothetical protein
MNDTSKAVEAKYREMLLRLPPQQRFYLAAGMFSDARALVLASLQNHIPPGSTLQCELFKRFYACDFTPEEAEKIIDHLRHGVGRFEGKIKEVKHS